MSSLVARLDRPWYPGFHQRNWDERRVANVAGIPYENDRFDLVFSDNLLEHLAEPLAVFRGVARVLKPGGVFFFKTPNKWHYTLGPWTAKRIAAVIEGSSQD